MSRRVAVVGVGHSKFGKRSDALLEGLAREAVQEALDDARLSPRDVEFLYVSNTGLSHDSLPAVEVAEACGLTPKGSMRIEAACASGSAAVYAAYMAIRSGLIDVALVVGVEKMTELPTPDMVELIGRAGNYLWEFQHFGLTFPGYYALYATAYLHAYPAARPEDLAEVAIKNHHYGALNPKAHMRRPITLDEYLGSKMIAWPLRLYDCTLISDGAAAVVLAGEELARRLSDAPVWIEGLAGATGTYNLSLRGDFLGLEPAALAAKEAYRRAGIDWENPTSQLDVAEVHDCFTIAELLAYEDLHFCPRGEGYKLARERQTYAGGKIGVNLDGGLKAKGHPIGATGVSMYVEVTRQLQGRVEKGRQAPIRRGRGLVHNVGGTGHYAYVGIVSLGEGKA
ncbi:MAG: acetyl-CoA acetyltransferase [Nitrososphaerota archaeon]